MAKANANKTTSSVDELQRAAALWGLRRALRASAAYSLFAGIFAVVLPIKYYNASITHPIVLIGSLIAISALMSLVVPNARLLLLEGVGLILLSAALTGMQINGFIAHPRVGFLVVLLLFGMPFLLYGMRYVRMFSAYSSIRPESVSPDQLDRVDDTFQRISRADVRSSEDVIELVVTGRGLQSWRVGLDADRAIFLNASTFQMIFLRKPDVTFEIAVNPTGDFDRIAFSLRGTPLKAMIAKSAVEKLHRWKT